MNDLTALPGRQRRELARAVSNMKYEFTDDGRIFLPEQKLFAGGVFTTEHRRYEPSTKRRILRPLARLPLVGKQFKAMRLKGGGDLLSRDISANVLPTEGLNHSLDVILHAGTQVTAWYVALFEANVTPGATLTAATFTSTTTECTAYDETTRVAYVEAAAAAGVTTNSASRAEFTMNATKTIYGGALLSVSTKSATTGTLLAAAKFSASRAVVDDDVLAVAYTITLTSS